MELCDHAKEGPPMLKIVRQSYIEHDKGDKIIGKTLCKDIQVREEVADRYSDLSHAHPKPRNRELLVKNGPGRSQYLFR
jgi:hypothetical protein